MSTGRLRAAEISVIDREDGLALLELAYYVAILSVVLTPLVSFVLTGTDAMTEQDTITRLQERNRVALFRVARDVRSAIVTTVAVGVSGESVSFTLPDGFDGIAPTPGDRITYSLTPSLEGSGQLVRVNETTGEEVVLTRSVDLDSSGFVQNGAGVDITIANAGVRRQNGAALTVSRQVTAFPRN